MTGLAIAIAVHVLGVIWWIGGLAFVTLVFLPALRHGITDDPDGLLDAIERRFGPQARIASVLVGASGAYMLWRLGAWQWLGLSTYWWLDAMMAYWGLFVLLLFVLEPAGLLRRGVRRIGDPVLAWRAMHVLHGALLLLGVVIIAAAAAASHGY